MTDTILETEGLTKEFRGFVAVSDVDLSVRRGTIHGLIGPNGAGKTTCFNLLTKFLPPTRGSIRYDGRDITGMKPAEVARLGLVRSLPDLGGLPASERAGECPRGAAARRAAAASISGARRRCCAHYDDRARALLEDVGLTAYAAVPPASFPMAASARWRSPPRWRSTPTMMLLDEPTAGMTHEDVGPDRGAGARVSAGRTVLLVEHNLTVVVGPLRHHHRADARQRAGRGRLRQRRRNPEVMAAYLGTEAAPRGPAHG